VWKPVRSDAVRRLSVTVVERGVEGKEVGEEARCTGACGRKTGERGTASGDTFLWWLDSAAGRKRAGGLAWCTAKKGEKGGPIGVARSRAGVLAGSGTDATEAGDSQAARSCGSRGWGGTNKWASPKGGAQRHRERRKRGRVTGGTAGFK
jgi:hypothetical protein